MADRELLALRDEIALVDTRLSQLLSGLETGETDALWGRLYEAYVELQAGWQANDGKIMLAALERMGQIIEAGGSQRDVWGEVYVILEQRRRLVESERKRLVAMQQMITAEQAIAMLARIQQVIVETVDDRNVLSSIIAEFKRLSTIEPGEWS
jgi:hypothetical protein